VKDPRVVSELSTPAAVIDLTALDSNLTTMAQVLPGDRLRPHVKATKCTALARRQVAVGHRHFTCATPREILGMVRAGVGESYLLANETLDDERLRALAAVQHEALIMIAIDSTETLDAADRAGIGNVVIDVNVGLPRCGIPVDDAGRLADDARARGLTVHGVMGYEGHLMMVGDADEKQHKVDESMALLRQAASDVGGTIISAGGTGTFNMHAHTGVTDVQAGSYSLMDTQYAALGLPFTQAMFVLGTVISRTKDWAVIDAGLKSLGMDHGNPHIEGATIWFVSDEHITFSMKSSELPRVGDKVRVTPAHIDPTMAMHEVAWAVNRDTIVDRWGIDLRGW
jgi:D-serine deaminase-like pyridoxal phosphate-dependent protein